MLPHRIPKHNGKIDCVSNMTHGWSRAVFDIGISHKEDADAVMNTLLTLAADLQHEPAFCAADHRRSRDARRRQARRQRRDNQVRDQDPAAQAMGGQARAPPQNQAPQELRIETAMPQQFILREPTTTETLPEDGSIPMPRRAA